MLRWLAGGVAMMLAFWGAYAVAQEEVPVVTSRELPEPGKTESGGQKATTQRPAGEVAPHESAPQPPRRRTEGKRQEPREAQPAADSSGGAPEGSAPAASRGKSAAAPRASSRSSAGKRTPAFWIIDPMK